MSDARDLATVELLGALTYGQLRAFEVTARAIRCAPTSRLADRLASYAVREHERYVKLRDRLIGLTDLGGPAMDRQKRVFDAFFDHAPVDEWLPANTFFAIGLPLAADFIREIAPALDEETASVVVDALAGREAFEEFAIDQVVATIHDDEEGRLRTRGLVADLLGRALTGFQASLADTDALHVLLGGDDGSPEADALVRRVAVSVLDGHRRRMHAMGLENLEEL